MTSTHSLDAVDPAPWVALVLGSGSHALAIIRALHRSDISLHVISHHSEVPANFSRFGSVRVRCSIATDKFIDVLKEERSTFPVNAKVVLFPTNDRMVQHLVAGWQALDGAYLLSWSSCLAKVGQLQNKITLSAICEELNYSHPRSLAISGRRDIELLERKLSKPWVVKPAQPGPGTGFKTEVVRGKIELENLIDRCSHDLPFIAQEWVEGTVTSLLFCTMFTMNGRAVACVTGRKVDASRGGIGVGCVMETEPIPRVEELARAFVLRTELSGPVSIEFKQAPDGQLVLIEPNVGRMERCIEVAVRSGVNLPLIEFLTTVGAPSEVAPQVGAVKRVAWFDTEADPYCFVRTLLRQSRHLFQLDHLAFPYFRIDDLRPFAVAAMRRLSTPVRILYGKLRRRHGRG